MRVLEGLIVFSLLSIAQLARCGNEAEWLRVETSRCLPDALALQTRRVSSKIMCIGIASTMSGLLVAQFDSDTRQCSLFKYIVVCHLIDGQASNGINALHSCAAFANARAVRFMTLSRKLMSSVGSKLRAAWVMSDDEEASKSNLVCGETQQWQSESVEFTSGAKFNGVSSNMSMDNADFGETEQGLSLLIRKRQFGSGMIFTKITCGTDLMWYCLFKPKLSSDEQTSFSRHSILDTVFFVAAELCDIYSEDFVDLAVISPSMNKSLVQFNCNSEYYGLQDEFDFPLEKPVLDSPSCLYLGAYTPEDLTFNGTIRAVAIANDTLTEAEISKFFITVR